MPDPGSAFTAAEITRYSRHLLMPQVGAAGQQKLKKARVVCVGVGGLGSPVSMYLAAAGVGTLGIVDCDTVDLTNLQRQVLFGTSDIGRPKLEAAAERLRTLNPEIEVVPHDDRLTSANALDILARYDIVVDGTDNFPTRYLLNDACVLRGKPYVYGSVFRFEGQASVFATPGGPCYRCLYPEPPEPGAVPSCSEAGVLGVLPGIVGTIQATETIKLVLGMPGSLAGRLLIVEAERMHVREVRLNRDPDCPVCGDAPTIRELIDYDAFCGLEPAAAPALPGGGAVPAAAPPSGEAAAGAAGRHEISVTELWRRMKTGDAPVLVDVRDPYERAIVGLPDALAIGMTRLSACWDELPRDRDIVFFCRSGERSGFAVAALRARGLTRAYNLRGGILAWIAEVDPSLPRY